MDAPFPTATQTRLLEPAQQPQLAPGRLSRFSFRCSSSRMKALALINKQAFPSEYCGSSAWESPRSWRIWPWSAKESSSGHSNNNSSVDFPEKARWAVLLLYRALLIFGTGLGAIAPAMAKSKSSSPASEVLVQKAIKKAAHKTAEKSPQLAEKMTDNIAEKGVAQAVSNNEVAASLGEDFWKDLDLSKGSIVTILKSILDGNPTNNDALECLAKTLLDNDDAARALIVVEKLELLEPEEMEWKYLRAMAYDAEGQFQKAKNIYEDILKIEPFSSKAIQGLMMAMDELGETDAIVEVAEDAMMKAREEKNIIEARNIGMLIGQYFMMKGHLYDALEHYYEMAEEDPKDFRPHLCQGIIYSALGEKSKAEKEFNAYEKLCPKDYTDRKYLNELMLKAKQAGQKQYEVKQKEKYVKRFNFEKGSPER